MSASPSQLTVSGDPSSAFNPSTSTTDPFSGTPYAAATAPAVGGPVSSATTSPTSPTNPRKRRASHQQLAPNAATIAPSSVVAGGGTSAGTASAYTTDHHASAMGGAVVAAEGGGGNEPQQPVQPPPPKKGRTNTPWTAAEEQRLKIMRDAGNSWSEIAKVRRLFPLLSSFSVLCFSRGSCVPTFFFYNHPGPLSAWMCVAQRCEREILRLTVSVPP